MTNPLVEQLQELGIDRAGVVEILGGSRLSGTDLDGNVTGSELAIRDPPPLGFWARDIGKWAPPLSVASERYLNLDSDSFEALRRGLLMPSGFDEAMLLALSELSRLVETAEAHPELAVIVAVYS